MHKVTFYPLGNAACCKLDLSDGRKLLFDYANCRDTEDRDDLRIDLASVLREDLKTAERTYFDVVAFTHCDDDHIHGFSEFFNLQHAKKYQACERINITELWVPAAIVIEEVHIPEQIGRRSGANRPPFRTKSATLPEQIGHPCRGEIMRG
jgi:ribonuclease BN (tRNA processing enzyme)